MPTPNGTLCHAADRTWGGRWKILANVRRSQVDILKRVLARHL